MATFKDNSGDEYSIRFDGLILSDVESEAKVDLVDLQAGGLLLIHRDYKALVRCLVVLCRDEIERGTEREFAANLTGDAIPRAIAAIVEAAADFFPSEVWSKVRLRLDHKLKASENVTDVLDKVAKGISDSPGFATGMEKELLDMIEGSSTDGSAKTDPNSAGGLESTQPTTASDLPANVESTPAA